MTLRGNRHAPDLWKRLLPSAQKRLIAEGLFNPDGTITQKGRDLLANGGPLPEL